MKAMTRALIGALFLSLLAGPLTATAATSRLEQLEARVEALAAQFNALPARASATAAVPADIVGTWNLKGFQSEMGVFGTSWQVRSYVFKGTITFLGNGRYTQKVSESGNELVASGTVINSFANPEGLLRGKWKLVGNQVVLDDNVAAPLDLDAGLSVMTYTGANPADHTNVMLVITKQPAP
jgi:hypothetical protein